MPPGPPETPAENAPEDLVRRLCELARLELPEEELTAAVPHLERILGAFHALAEAPIAPPATDEPPPAADASRPDEPAPSLPPGALLRNAPERIEDFYGVPKTLGGPA